MRPHSLMLVTLVAVGVSSPVFGQVAANGHASAGPVVVEAIQLAPVDALVVKSEPVGIAVSISSGTRSRDVTAATPDAMVARLMSFDANHDGRVSRNELPERMQGLFARADASKDGVLDADEVRRFAQRPPVRVVASSLIEPGHYGFGDDFGLDTRLHFDSAIEDLRLASAKQNEALGIGRQFIDRVNAEAKADVLAAAEPILSPEQFADFKATVDRSPGNSQILVPSASIQGREDIHIVLNSLNEQLRLARQRNDLSAVVSTYQLGASERRALMDAAERFQSHDSLTPEVRTALLQELHDVLTDQERDDLDAALTRRPIVKQGELLTRRVQTSQGPQTAPAPAVQGVTVKVF